MSVRRGYSTLYELYLGLGTDIWDPSIDIHGNPGLFAILR